MSCVIVQAFCYWIFFFFSLPFLTFFPAMVSPFCRTKLPSIILCMRQQSSDLSSLPVPQQRSLIPFISPFRVITEELILFFFFFPVGLCQTQIISQWMFPVSLTVNEVRRGHRETEQSCSVVGIHISVCQTPTDIASMHRERESVLSSNQQNLSRLFLAVRDWSVAQLQQRTLRPSGSLIYTGSVKWT